MRVVVLGAGGAHRTETSIARALRTLGHRCRQIDIPAWKQYAGPLVPALVHRLVERFRPDAVILTRPAHVLGEERIRALAAGRAGGLWYFDLTSPPAPAIVSLGRAVGTLFVTCYSQLGAYRAAGIPRVHYLPQGIDPAIDQPVATAPAEFRCDFSFLGSGHYPYRHAVLRRLAGVGTLQIRGLGWDGAAGLPVVSGPVHGTTLAQVIRGAAVSIGAHATPEQDAACGCASNRMWKIFGGEGFYLGPWQDGIEHFARGGEHCAWYRGIDEAVELARYYLNRPRERAEMAAAARAHALEHHTYAHRVELLLAGRSYRSDK